MYMKIIKNGSRLNVEIPQKDFRFWDKFCDFFIEKCDRLLQNQSLDKLEKQHFQSIKESLESILFKIDINQVDSHVMIDFESTYLRLYLTMMERWKILLEQTMNIKKKQLKEITNGENKRQLTDEIEFNTYLIDRIDRLVNQFNTF